MTSPSNISRFLPPNYDPTATVALIAGQGLYPRLVAQAVRQAGVPLRLIHLEGETDDATRALFENADVASVRVGQIGKMLKRLKSFDARYVYMAGQVTPGRLFRDLHPDLKALAMLAQLKEKNAETIFGAIRTEIEATGATLLDARAFLDSELAHEGWMAGELKKPYREQFLDHGIRIATAVAAEDIGQGCVVRKGTVLAVEAFEGTNAMLRRAGGFKTEGLIFVKCGKPYQDTRFDIPVFGLQTLDVMTEAGIGLAALQTDRVLILEKEKVLAEAVKRGIGIVGFG